MPDWDTIRAVYRGSTPVNKVYVGEDWKWPPHDFLTFSSPNSFDISINNNTKNWDGTLEYSTDKYTWTTWDGSQSIAAVASDGMYYLYLRGSNNTKITGAYDGTNWQYSWYISGTDVSIDGDIRYLLNYQDPENSSMATYCFTSLFYNCSSIISAPSLPFMSLTTYCYRAMFDSCTSLISAPSLPATTLASGCYYGMFNGCTSLINAPSLLATTMTSNCYRSMFSGCTSLVNAPSLPATTLAGSCYNRMFYGCTRLSKLPALPALDVPNTAYYYMFRYCSAIYLSQSQTGDYQTAWRIPTSGTGTIGTDAVTSMFANTGGTFTGTPNINTTYYTSNAVA